MDQNDDLSRRPVRILSLDGDLSGGLSTLIIANRLSQQLGKPGSPKKLCEAFDLIVGSGVGGLIALLLGRLALDVQQAIVKFKTLWSSLSESQAQRRYLWRRTGNLAPLKDFMSGLQGMEPFQTSVTSCRTLALTSYHNLLTIQPVCLRSYATRAPPRHTWTVTEVACATMSNPSHFETCTIDGQVYQDASGSGAMNPAEIARHEAINLEDPVWQERLKSGGMVMVSIGTGIPTILRQAGNREAVAETYRASARDAGRVHSDLFAYFQQSRYYRFNGPEIGNLRIFDSLSEQLVEPLTETYLQGAQVKVKLRNCAVALKVFANNLLQAASGILTWVLLSGGSYSESLFIGAIWNHFLKFSLLQTPIDLPSLPSETSSLPGSSAQNDPILLWDVPTKPIIFGREEECAQLLQHIKDGSHVAIAGVGGLGKSTLSLHVLHHPEIETPLGTRRHFVRCDQIVTSTALQEKLLLSVRGKPFNSTEDGPLFLALKGVLHGDSLLIVLDNFEDPYNSADQSAVVDFLEILVEIPNLTLIITTRNATVADLNFSGGRSIQLLELTPLLPEDAMKLFNRRSYNRYSLDPFLPDLLRLLDGHPLTITLMASYSRQAPSLKYMVDQWENCITTSPTYATSLTYARASRMNNLQFALDLSMDSLKIQSTMYATELLSVLALLPFGIRLEDAFAPDDREISIAVRAVLATSLAYIDERVQKVDFKYLRTLVPVSTYLRNRLPAPDPCFVRRIATTLFKAVDSVEWTAQLRYSSEGVINRVHTLTLLADYTGQQSLNVAGDEFEIARGLALARVVDVNMEWLYVLEPMRAARNWTMEKVRKNAMGFLDQDLREQVSSEQVSVDRSLVAMDLARGYGCTDEAYWTPERHQEAEAWEDWFEAMVFDQLAYHDLPTGRSADEDIFRLGRHAVRMGLMGERATVEYWKSGWEMYEARVHPESAEKEWRDLMEEEEREFERLASEREGRQAAVL
ncbi:hypothetical protein P7C70_g1568, partial [Phenoliferia sp. Uapishka_3]